MFVHTSADANERFGQSMVYNEDHGFTTIYTLTDSYRVYLCGDTHVDTTAQNWERFVLAYKSDLLCPFAIHVGDEIHGKNHWDMFYATAAKRPDLYTSLKDTLFVTPGNHDICFGQWEQYRQYRRSSTYYFETKTLLGKRLDLYICLDSAEGTLGSDAWKWLRGVLEDAKGKNYRHIIIFSHVNLFRSNYQLKFSSNFPLEETYELTQLLTRYGVDMYICGHDHYRHTTLYGGVKYVTLDTLKDGAYNASYMIATMGEKVVLEWIEIKEVEK